MQSILLTLLIQVLHAFFYSAVQCSSCRTFSWCQSSNIEFVQEWLWNCLKALIHAKIFTCTTYFAKSELNFVTSSDIRKTNLIHYSEKDLQLPVLCLSLMQVLQFDLEIVKLNRYLIRNIRSDLKSKQAAIVKPIVIIVVHCMHVLLAVKYCLDNFQGF